MFHRTVSAAVLRLVLVVLVCTPFLGVQAQTCTPPPTPVITTQQPHCPNQYVSASVATSTWQSVQWTIENGVFYPSGATTASGEFVQWSATSTSPVTLRAIGSDGSCASETAVSQIAITAIPIVITAPDSTCSGLTQHVTVEPPSTGGSWMSIEWTIANGFYLDPYTQTHYGTTSGQNAYFQADGSGEVTLAVTAVDSDGCVTQSTKQIAVTSLPAPEIYVDPEICPRSDHYAGLAAPESGMWGSIRWTIAGGMFRDGSTGQPSSTATGPSVMFFAFDEGAVPVELQAVATDSNGCTTATATKVVSIRQIAAPEIYVDTEICPRSDHYVGISAPESGMWREVQWTITGGAFRDPFTGEPRTTASGPSAMFYANEDGAEPVVVTAVAIDSYGCLAPAATKQVAIRQIAAPEIYADEEICPRSDHYVGIAAPNAGPWRDVQWTITGGAFRDPFTGEPRTTASGPSAMFYANEDGAEPVVVSVVAIDADGCLAPTATKQINIRHIDAPYIYADEEICPRSDHYVGLGSPVAGPWRDVQWTITGGAFRDPFTGQPSTTASGPSAMFYANEDGAAPVVVTAVAIDANGCLAPTVTKEIRIRHIDAPYIYTDEEICPRSDHWVGIGSPVAGPWRDVQWSIVGGVFRDPNTGTIGTTASGPWAMYTADEDRIEPLVISVSAIDDWGCLAPPASKQVAIRQIAAPYIYVETEICPNSDHMATVGAPQANGWREVNWNITGGLFRDPSTGTTSTSFRGVHATYFAEGSTPVQLTVSGIDDNGCLSPPASATVAIRHISQPVLYTVSSTCSGQEQYASLGAPQANGWSSVHWTITNGTFRDPATGARSTTYTGLQAYWSAGNSPTVTLSGYGIDVNGCQSPPVTRTISVRTIPSPSINTVISTCPNFDRTASLSGTWSSAVWTIEGGTFADGTTTTTGFNPTYRGTAGNMSMLLSVTATNAEGCSATNWTSIYIYEPSTPEIDTVAEACAHMPATASVMSPYPTEWTIAGGVFEGGGTTAEGTIVTYIPNGGGDVTLSVRWTDMNTCPSYTGTRTVSVREPVPMTMTADLTACPSVPRTASVTGNASAVTWTIENGHFLDAQNQPVSTTTGTSVTYVANVGVQSVNLYASSTDANGCPNSGSAVVAVGAGNGQIFVSDTSVCAGATGTANPGTPARGPWTSVQWSIVNGTGTPSGLNFNYTVGQSGVTTITMTATDDWGCSVTESIDIAIEAPSATVTASGSTHLCANGSVTLTAVENGTYLWSNGATTKSITVSAAGNYSVAITNANGCTATSAPVSVTAEGVVPSGIQWSHVWGPLCEGMSNTLTAANVTGATYLWSTGETTRSITVTTSGTYSVTVTTPGGCTSDSSTTVNFSPAPKPTLELSQPAQYCGELTIEADYYPWNVERIWWEHDPGSQGYAIGTTYTAYGSGRAWFNVKYVTGCVRSSDPVTYSRLNGPDAWSPETVTMCNGQPVTLEVYGKPDMTVSWSTGATSRAIVVTQPGTYTWSATGGTDQCTQTGSIQVLPHDPAPVTVSASGATTFCEGGSVTLTADNTASSYLWSTGATTRSITVSQSGSYTVSAQDGTGCMVPSSPVQVTVNARPTAVVSGTTGICAGASATISAALTGTGPWNVIWSDGFVQNGVAASPATRVVSPSATTSYSITSVSDAHCTGTASGTATITVNAKPVAGIRAMQAYDETRTGTVTQNGENVEACGNPLVRLVPQALDPSFTYAWSTGATTAVLDVTASGTYTLTVTTPSGCATSSTVNVTVNPYPAKPVINAPQTQLCPAGGSVTLTAPAATSWLWSNGATTQSIVVTEAGSYSVRTRNGSCESVSSDSVTITRGTSSITASGSTSLCENGSVTLTANEGTAWSWSNGATTRSITVTAPGSYSVTTTNGSCTADPSAAVEVTQREVAIAASGPTTFCAGGSVTLTATEGASYLWSNGATSRSITVNTSGAYDVLVTFADGCAMRTASTVVDARQITASIAADRTAICAGQSIALTSSVGGGTSYAYQWYDNTYQPIADATGATLTLTPTTNGFVYLKVTDSLGCEVTTNAVIYTVDEPVDATITASGPTTFCEGGSVTLTAPPAASYLWSTGASGPSITVSASGTYSVTTSNGACTATGSVTVTVNPVPTATITASGPTTFCAGGSVTLTAPDGYSYLWSNGATTRAITVNASGTYSVTTTLGSCTATDSVTVTVNPTPSATITANGPLTFCEGGNVTLTAPDGYAYLWSNGATSQSITVNASGTYTVTTTLGSCTATDSKTVTVNPAPSATISANGPLTFCEGGNVTLTAPAASSYAWSTGATTQSITVNSSGTYTVTTTLGSCSATDSVTVTVNPTPSATITANGPLTFCEGGNVTLTAPAASSYAWSNGATTQSITVDASGTYTVTTTLGSCTATDSKTVTVNPTPDPTISANGPLAFCAGGSVKLSAPLGATSYLWSNGATSREITVTTGGTYTVTATLGSCTATDSETVTVNPTPDTTITANGPLSFCAGGSVKLSAPLGATSYLWSNGATTREITVTTGGTYTVTATLGSCTATDAETVTVNAMPDATISANGPLAFCAGGSVKLSAPLGATSYLWSNGANSREIIVTTGGIYTVTATIGSCSATDAETVTVNAMPDATITASGPTTFCDGGEVTLSAPLGAASYLWSNGATTREITVTASGTYTVTATIGSCTDTDSITITERPPTVITGEPQNVTMARNVVRTLSVTATGATPLTYQWYRGTTGVTGDPITGATNSTLDVSQSKKGTFNYWVRVRSSACTSSYDDSRTVVVTVN
jgi:hypothetical protein